MWEHQRKECVYNKGLPTCLGSQRFSYTGLILLHISEFSNYSLCSPFTNAVSRDIQYGIFTMGCKEASRIVKRQFRRPEKELNIFV
jgi:hypothetical protein